MTQPYYKIIIFGCVFAFWQFASTANANTELSKMYDCTDIELVAVVDQGASREDNLARLSQQFFQSLNAIEHCDREEDSDGAASSNVSDSVSSNPDADGADATSVSGGATDKTASTNTGAENASSAEADAASASSEQMTAASDSENAANTDADNTTIDRLASDMVATRNANQLDKQSVEQSTSQATHPTAPTASGSLMGRKSDQITAEPHSAFAVPSASNMVGTTPHPTPAKTITSGAQTDAAEQNLRFTNGKTPDDIPDVENDSVFEAQIRLAATEETDPDTKKNLWNEYRRYKGLPEQK